jgi:hypothetical protein
MASQNDSSAMDNSPAQSRPALKFRVLILGRANAGKTTILERIAGAAVSDAEVWRGGEKLPAPVCWPSFSVFVLAISDELLVDDQGPERCEFKRCNICWCSPGLVACSAAYTTLRMSSAFRPGLGSSSTTRGGSNLARLKSLRPCGSLWRFDRLQERFLSSCMPYGMNSGVVRVVMSHVFFRMCVPLDESRELFQGERAPFGWSKGVGKMPHTGVSFPLDCDCTIAPLVVIFTKRDGAALKETSRIIEQMTKDSSGTTISRSAKNRARGEADRLVTHRIHELEGELRDLSPHKDTLGFLTAGGKLLLDRTLRQPFKF